MNFAAVLNLRTIIKPHAAKSQPAPHDKRTIAGLVSLVLAEMCIALIPTPARATAAMTCVGQYDNEITSQAGAVTDSGTSTCAISTGLDSTYTKDTDNADFGFASTNFTASTSTGVDVQGELGNIHADARATATDSPEYVVDRYGYIHGNALQAVAVSDFDITWSDQLIFEVPSNVYAVSFQVTLALDVLLTQDSCGIESSGVGEAYDTVYGSSKYGTSLRADPGSS